MPRPVLAILLALALPALAPAAAPAALDTILQDDGAMLHRPPEQVAAAAARMKSLGIDRVRITASWSSITRDADAEARPAFDARDPGAYEQSRWAALDTAVRAVSAAGMAVMIDIGFWAPHWATNDAPGPRARTDIDPAHYADFAAAVARRYAGDYTPPAGGPVAPSQDEQFLDRLFSPPFRSAFRSAGASAAQASGPLPRVAHFLLYNEPNHQGLLMPQWSGRTPASPHRYRAMVRAAYPAIKTVQPSAAVLIGNTSSTGGRRGAGSVAPLEFIRELACVDSRFRPRSTPECAGFQTVPGDGFAHHPYALNESPSRRSSPRSEAGDVRIADLPALARTLSRLVALGRLAPANRAIDLTEFGYETARVRGRPTVTQATQARWLTWAEYLADRVPAVRSFAQFLLRDQGRASERVSDSGARPFGEYATGLLRADGREKIAARTFRAGLFAQRRGRSRVMLYARLRLGPGVKTIGLERRARGGRYRRVARVRVDGRAAFTRTVRHRPGARYRLRYPGERGRRVAGLSVRAVPEGR